MKGLFLNERTHNKLILFFNGWSLDENIVNHLTSSEYDVIMFYDYSNLGIDENILNEINNYEEVNIIAWSFGVWACGEVINKFNNPKNVIAINGTLIPIDNNFGIPEKIFNLTLSNLSEKSYPKFFKNMFSEEVDLNRLPKRTIENQKQELIQIKKNSSLPPPSTKGTAELVEASDPVSVAKRSVRGRVGVGGDIQYINLFTKIFISNNDKIISAKNQINFWSQRKDLNIIEKDCGHYIPFKNWDEIING